MNEDDIIRLTHDPARQCEARDALRDLLDGSPRALAYKRWQQLLPDGMAALPVAVVASFTIETIEPYLCVEAYLSGWRPQTTYIQYGQWQNALLSPSDYGLDRVRAAVLLLHDAELIGPNTLDAREPLERIGQMVAAFRAATSVPLFIGIAHAPPARDGQALALHQGPSYLRARAELHLGMTELARHGRDVHLLHLDPETLGAADWFDPVGYFATRSVFSHRALPGLARTLARNLGCLFRARRKVLVLDLDNSLWGGVVGEDGIDGLDLESDYPGAAFIEFQQQLAQLRATGVLLAVASKNNEADAIAVFERRPEMRLQWKDFSAHRVNWRDKAANIAEMADELGLGLDSFVFADDSPIECALVRRELPQVQVVELGKDPARFGERLFRTQAFDVLHVSEEDRSRADSYAAEAGRRSLRDQVTDIATFLQGCELQLSIQPAGPNNLDRIHQLLSKTNQFNFTLERHPKEVLHALSAREHRLFGISLKDRFGDYGLVGILHVEPGDDSFLIANMALSCRALGRGVEDAMLAFVRELAHRRGHESVHTDYVRGPRNQQILEFLERTGFKRTTSGDDRVTFAINLAAGTLPWPNYITVQHPLLEMVH